MIDGLPGWTPFIWRWPLAGPHVLRRDPAHQEVHKYEVPVSKQPSAAVAQVGRRLRRSFGDGRESRHANMGAVNGELVP